MISPNESHADPHIVPATVPLEAVQINDAFWSARIRTNRQRTIPHLLDICELEGRVRNMLRAAGRLDGAFEGDSVFGCVKRPNLLIGKGDRYQLSGAVFDASEMSFFPAFWAEF